MLNSSMTTKGQVTIPAQLRERLGLKPGDKVAFLESDGKIILQRLENRVEAAFGLIKSTKSATLAEIDEVIKQTRADRARR